MAEEEQQQVEAARQEGKVRATVRGATVDQVWPLVADFCNVHRWIPGVSICRLEGGVAGEPGCIRYCTVFTGRTCTSPSTVSVEGLHNFQAELQRGVLPAIYLRRSGFLSAPARSGHQKKQALETNCLESMAEEEQQQVEAARQEGKVSATVRGATVDQVWPLLADFCNVHRWIPGVSICRLEGGVAGEPGCIRYCAGKGENADGGDVPWAREKLTVIDHAGRKLSYVVIENNIGLKNYEATVGVVEGEEGGEGCIIEWRFRMEPVSEGNGVEVVPFVTSTLEGMVKTMEEFFAATAAAGGDVQDLVGTVVA